ncbi:kinase-like domain-containing protein [Pyronema domesticum]|uniref:Similar to Calcium/calmodulin-dependent protein kinase kinase 1 acc. no. P97756 n=1 Tax=Pyronema omphalodes (strain CBS 100304) TaxID=1076935 RepID=U4LHY0_PYROM|nr:kinase-like domain-containing protein [Pyronema domesticum]CCX11803.1 Similar to Calcium/calmodulin-dependent protein kinase kinase 1; acc. no. P97756 [Pyronema omphalodes CBS 100304]
MLSPIRDEAPDRTSDENQSPAQRPYPQQHGSSPSGTFISPARHHRRIPSINRTPVKETLNASLEYDDEDDSGQGMRINQYILKQEIGRGSFGAVHLAVDQQNPDNQYAVKEISKSRLRKKDQANLLRQPPGARRGGGGFHLNRRSVSDITRAQELSNPLYLIREEIAILKKLDHQNVVSLIEVLDDPEGDSFYMVLEWCAKGVIMKVDLDRSADPYPEEQCRLWFRDMILGIEYLHSQGIVHRDIKPDNLLLTSDDVLKIVDFGVSEMFEKDAPMRTAKFAGSPAFLPPELCKVGHGDVDGRAADIWSMGVTLYCLLFGRLPFSHHVLVDLYNAIQEDLIQLPTDIDPDLSDLLHQLLQKDPERRITMKDLRNHAWVTRSGSDPLLSEEDNTTEFIPPTKDELDTAITKSIGNFMAVVRAVRKLKRLTLGRSRNTKPTKEENHPVRSQNAPVDQPGNYQQQLNAAGVNTEISLDGLAHALPTIHCDGEGLLQESQAPSIGLNTMDGETEGAEEWANEKLESHLEN